MKSAPVAVGKDKVTLKGLAEASGVSDESIRADADWLVWILGNCSLDDLQRDEELRKAIRRKMGWE